MCKLTLFKSESSRAFKSSWPSRIQPFLKVLIQAFEHLLSAALGVVELRPARDVLILTAYFAFSDGCVKK
jgi:hypothetical protein